MTNRTHGKDHQDRPEQAPRHAPKDDRHTELCVMTLMLDENSSYPWSTDELIRMMDGNRVSVLDAINNLQAAGLLHRIDQFVWPTLTARRTDELEDAGT